MQRPDEQKRQDIQRVAARLFATRPFHQVRLEDVATEARIGKGTIYIYFKNKQRLYADLTRQALADLRDGLELRLASAPSGAGAIEQLGLLVRELVRFGRQNPHFFQLLRAAGVQPRSSNSDDIQQRRREVVEVIEAVIRRGVRRGELADPHPEVTADFIMSFARAAWRHPEDQIGESALTRHMLRIITRGILRNSPDSGVVSSLRSGGQCDAVLAGRRS